MSRLVMARIVADVADLLLACEQLADHRRSYQIAFPLDAAACGQPFLPDLPLAQDHRVPGAGPGEEIVRGDSDRRPWRLFGFAGDVIVAHGVCLRGDGLHGQRKRDAQGEGTHQNALPCGLRCVLRCYLLFVLPRDLRCVLNRWHDVPRAFVRTRSVLRASWELTWPRQMSSVVDQRYANGAWLYMGSRCHGRARCCRHTAADRLT